MMNEKIRGEVEAINLGRNSLSEEEYQTFKSKPEEIWGNLEQEEYKKFDKILNSLQEKGVQIEVFSTNNKTERSRYTPEEDKIYVRNGHLSALIEELIHRAQCMAVKREYGSLELLEDNKIAKILGVAAELGASSLAVEMEERKLKKAFESIKDTLEYSSMAYVYEGLLETCKSIRKIHSENLYHLLEQLSKEQLEKLKPILNHPLFAGTKEILNLVQDGIKADEIWGEIKP